MGTLLTLVLAGIIGTLVVNAVFRTIKDTKKGKCSGCSQSCQNGKCS